MGTSVSRHCLVPARPRGARSRGGPRSRRTPRRRRRSESQDPFGGRAAGRARSRDPRRRLRLEPDAPVQRAEMTARREAIGLPIIFLTVVLLGGLRIGVVAALVPPSVFALVLGVLLVRVLVQCGAVAPERLVSGSRRALANANGIVVLVTLWAASSQAIALVIPDSGLPRLAMNVFFLVLLLNTAAASPDRVRLLRSLSVTFGSVFVLKFVVLYELSTPGTSWLKRVLQAMLEGITLGTLTQDPLRP